MLRPTIRSQSSATDRSQRSASTSAAILHSPNPRPVSQNGVFPYRSETLCSHRFVDRAAALHDFIRTEPRLPHVPQLRRNARRRVVRQFRQLVECQPRGALPRAEHHVANHFPLPSQNQRPDYFLLRPPHRIASFPASHSSSAGNSSLTSLASFSSSPPAVRSGSS